MPRFYGTHRRRGHAANPDRPSPSQSQPKRGSHQSLDELHEFKNELGAPSREILAVHEPLNVLADEEQLAAKGVKLHYFAGLSIAEIAKAIAIAPRTVDRHWTPRLGQRNRQRQEYS